MTDLFHIVTLLLFVLIGGAGMASMQDGASLVHRRLMMLFRKHPDTQSFDTIHPQNGFIAD